jgi:adenosylhomocysteinase
MDGNEVMPALVAAERGDVFITVTGGRDVLARAHFERMKDGAMLANAGHFNVEIAVDQLAELATARRQVLPLVEQFEVGPQQRLNLLAQGRVVNLAAAEGHPAAVMDMSFANQALSVEYLARHGASLQPRVLAVPPDIDQAVSRLTLESLGVRIDELSAGQRAYLTSWRV